jgi:DNA-binding NarL/FixJ family response regulator
MERQVLLAFTCCDTNDEIAVLLGIAESTVKTHVKNLFRTNPADVRRAATRRVCLLLAHRHEFNPGA